MGNGIGGGTSYSMNYNHYYRAPGMPTLPGEHNSVFSYIGSGTTEEETNSIVTVRNATLQETNGDVSNPVFAGSWDSGKLDSELHANAFWCLTASSPAHVKTGGDTTDRAWPDLDFGVITTYGGNAWLGCMDPDASAVEQQVGPLGPLPSGL